MQLMRRSVTAVALLTLVVGTASAQQQSSIERSRVALDMGTAVPIALLWKLNDDFALRPEVNFSHLTQNGNNANSQWRFVVGASALATVHRTNALTTYVGPRVAYLWSSQSNSPTDWSFAGIFGARYAISPRFGVSAETGLVYDRLHVASPINFDESNLQPWSRVSALLFF